MANIMRQKRSLASAAPSALEEGQLAFTFGDDKAYIGAPGATIRELPGVADKTKLDGIEALADVTATASVAAAGAVMETDFNSQTIMIAVADDTPLPVTVAASTFIGRKATGDTGTLSIADSKTMLGLTGTNSGDQTITLTGDVTGTGTGSFAATVAASSITLAKMADMATASFIGRNTAATGAPEVLSKATALGILNIEDGADVTDSTNVAAAGAVMEADTTTALMAFVVDEDNMVSDSATKVPTQQSVKAYVDGIVASGVNYKGSYDATSNIPDLDTSPSGVLTGDMYTVTVAGTFFTTAVEVGDVIIAEIDTAAVEADWTIVNKNLDDASIKVAYESNADTNAYDDAAVTKLGNIEAGAEVNLALVSQAIAEAGTEATAAGWSALRVRQNVEAATIDGGTF